MHTNGFETIIYYVKEKVWMQMASVALQSCSTVCQVRKMGKAISSLGRRLPELFRDSRGNRRVQGNQAFSWLLATRFRKDHIRAASGKVENQADGKEIPVCGCESRIPFIGQICQKVMD